MKSDLAIGPRRRLITAFGTVLYVDVASGELRHGEIGTSPQNAYFVVHLASAAPRMQGYLVHDSGESPEPILCLTDRCGLISQSSDLTSFNSPTLLEQIPLERGLIAFQAAGSFLSAIPGGRVSLSAPRCSTWELFVCSEDWCADATYASAEPILPADETSFDQKRIKSYIIHPLIRARANTKSKKRKILIYGYTKWSHGRVYYDLCTHLHRRGYIVDILDWQVNHGDYIREITPYYDLFMTASDGVRTLVDSYGVPYDKIIVVSHHELDIRMLIEQKGMEVFDRFANYGVVSEFLYCASLMQGVTRVPMVASLGINYSEFHADIPECLATVGYASSMSAKTYGIEWKRGELAEAAARDAGLDFRVAGSTGNQTSFHDMPGFYRTVDAVVTSSISEAAQLPVMEAAAAGRLVIGTPVGHFPLKAYQGGGIIAPVEANKFKAFTIATLQYYKNNPLAYIDKCRLIQESARKFDWQHSIEEWIELIETAGSHIDRKNKINDSTTVAESNSEKSIFDSLNLQDEFAFAKNERHAHPTNLCQLMSSFGSDKGGPYHNYTIVYDWLFSRFRNERLKIFELGLGTNKVGAPSSMGPGGMPGASLRGWRAYFDAAMIYGADIDRDILFEEDRIQTYWVDQTDSNAIRSLWEKLDDVDFDIMIDDGLHEAPANIRFFKESFGKLKSGGIYIIEDIRPDDVDIMASFAQSIAQASKCVICESLDHPLNRVDNRLLIVQKKVIA